VSLSAHAGAVKPHFLVYSMMNAKDGMAVMPDVQGAIDERRTAIRAAGIRGLRYPLAFVDPSLNEAGNATVATFTMDVAVPEHQRGAHMSRFIEVLHAHVRPMSITDLQAMAQQMIARLEAGRGSVSVTFPCFRSKRAPVSGTPSLMDYTVTLDVTADVSPAEASCALTVLVPVTSLCPCSRDISEYGAHNQRSHVTVTVEAQSLPGIGELIDMVEGCASSQLYGVLKRPDEKFVTERAYDNPKFVEDLARDVAVALEQDARIRRFRVDVENFEAIHNHSAFAIVEGPVKPGSPMR
jgi:GTP cyclohydrolase IB